MFSRLDEGIAFLLSLLGIVSALVTISEKILGLWRHYRDDETETEAAIQQLEKDVVRLRQALRQQHVQLTQLEQEQSR